MRGGGLFQGDEGGGEITPNEEQQKGHGGVVFVEDGVENGAEEIDSEKNLRIRHPASFVAVFLCYEGIALAFDFVFRAARELAFLSDDGFDDGLSVANGNSDPRGPYKRPVQEPAPPPVNPQL